MKCIHLQQTESTNSFLLDLLAVGFDLEDMSVFWTTRQTAGRGQMGNSWEAEPNRNVSFSVLLHPDFIAPRQQFVISELTALAVVDALCEFLPEPCRPMVSIKWPNDIFVGEEKICGMLIENQLMGGQLTSSVLGIGINVNQQKWVGNAPNPTSMRLVAGQKYVPEQVMQRVAELICRQYKLLRIAYDCTSDEIHKRFCQNLYRRVGLHPYVDAQTGEAFRASITDVEPTGPLHLTTEAGEERVYSFKEVRFVLPCGVTKE